MIDKKTLTHLKQLEAESIDIMREVIAEFSNPGMLYSVGKDSSVMLHLLQKAFYPAPPPLPLVHVDTQWKFKEMIEFRDRRAKEVGMELIVYSNPKGEEMNISPFTHGSALHTDIMKTEGLKNMLDIQKFDAVFGGARRDEEKSRAKERIYSFRDENHRWDPKNQRPELWNIYNGRHTKGESIRVFPLSNWTELDIWQYIYLEQIPIPLERLDSKDVRDLIPDIGYTREERNRHMYRIRHLIKTLQKNSVSTVASFVSPYRESRKAIREMVTNNVVVYVKADIETCKQRDYKGKYEKAMRGELQNFSGINDVYEEPLHAEIVIDTNTTSVEEAVKIIVKHVKKRYVK
jgi:sulfate adenylyltransferase small subunit